MEEGENDCVCCGYPNPRTEEQVQMRSEALINDTNFMYNLSLCRGICLADLHPTAQRTILREIITSPAIHKDKGYGNPSFAKAYIQLMKKTVKNKKTLISGDCKGKRQSFVDVYPLLMSVSQQKQEACLPREFVDVIVANYFGDSIINLLVWPDLRSYVPKLQNEDDQREATREYTHEEGEYEDEHDDNNDDNNNPYKHVITPPTIFQLNQYVQLFNNKELDMGTNYLSPEFDITKPKESLDKLEKQRQQQELNAERKRKLEVLDKSLIDIAQPGNDCKEECERGKAKSSSTHTPAKKRKGKQPKTEACSTSTRISPSPPQSPPIHIKQPEVLELVALPSDLDNGALPIQDKSNFSTTSEVAEEIRARTAEKLMILKLEKASDTSTRLQQAAAITLAAGQGVGNQELQYDYKTPDQPVTDSSWLLSWHMDLLSKVINNSSVYRNSRIQLLAPLSFSLHVGGRGTYSTKQRQRLATALRRALETRPAMTRLGFLINSSNVHWTGFVVDVEKSKCFYFDPLGNNLEDSLKNMVAVGIMALQDQRNPPPNIDALASITSWQFNKLALQNDSYNCGPLVMLYFMHLTTSPEVELTLTGVDKDLFSVERCKQLRKQLQNYTALSLSNTSTLGNRWQFCYWRRSDGVRSMDPYEEDCPIDINGNKVPEAQLYNPKDHGWEREDK